MPCTCLESTGVVPLPFSWQTSWLRKLFPPQLNPATVCHPLSCAGTTVCISALQLQLLEYHVFWFGCWFVFFGLVLKDGMVFLVWIV